MASHGKSAPQDLRDIWGHSSGVQHQAPPPRHLQHQQHQQQQQQQQQQQHHQQPHPQYSGGASSTSHQVNHPPSTMHNGATPTVFGQPSGSRTSNGSAYSQASTGDGFPLSPRSIVPGLSHPSAPPPPFLQGQQPYRGQQQPPSSNVRGYDGQHGSAYSTQPPYQQQQQQSHLQFKSEYPQHTQPQPSYQSNGPSGNWSSVHNTNALPSGAAGKQSQSNREGQRDSESSATSASKSAKGKAKGAKGDKAGKPAAARSAKALQTEKEPESPQDDAGSKTDKKEGPYEFVRKVYQMLDDPYCQSSVEWTDSGESFVVTNLNDFAEKVLSHHFRHRNFSSFVRQVNKYGFSKVSQPRGRDDNAMDRPAVWEFKHPDFIRGREDLLINVKRKLTATPAEPTGDSSADVGVLKEQVKSLMQSRDQMSAHITALTKQYQGVIGEMLTFQRNMVQQDQLMQNLVQYLMDLEAERKMEGPSSGPSVPSTSHAQARNDDVQMANAGNFLLGRPFDGDQRGAGYGSSSAGSSAATADSLASLASTGATSMSMGMSPLSPKSVASDLDTGRRDSLVHSVPSQGTGPGPSSMGSKGKGRADENARAEPSVYQDPQSLDPDGLLSKPLLKVAANAAANPSLAGFENAGLKVYTIGHLQPREDLEEFININTPPDGAGRTPPGARQDPKSYRTSVTSLEPNSSPLVRENLGGEAKTMAADPNEKNDGSEGAQAEGGNNMLRVRRSTLVPSWAVPPRVLVVDDDTVCRKLSSKFLEVFGCAIDVAVDGVNAVNKMNLEKYDLVLMDIVMPNLDGVSATSLIRQFDPRTPIISMTSNSQPNEVLTYMSSGMNDMLPKPFTKEGLFNMLEKHLIHLKTVQRMDEIPRALGLPPVSDDMMRSVLNASSGTEEGSFSGSSNSWAANASSASPAPRLSVYGATPSAGQGFAGDDVNLANPLAGMGFSDDEYLSMLQNLLASGAVADVSEGTAASLGASGLGDGNGSGVAGGLNRQPTSERLRRRSSMILSSALAQVAGANKRSLDMNELRAAQDDASGSVARKKARFEEIES